MASYHIDNKTTLALFKLAKDNVILTEQYLTFYLI